MNSGILIQSSRHPMNTSRLFACQPSSVNLEPSRLELEYLAIVKHLNTRESADLVVTSFILPCKTAVLFWDFLCRIKTDEDLSCYFCCSGQTAVLIAQLSSLLHAFASLNLHLGFSRMLLPLLQNNECVQSTHSSGNIQSLLLLLSSTFECRSTFVISKYVLLKIDFFRYVSDSKSIIGFFDLFFF